MGSPAGFRSYLDAAAGAENDSLRELENFIAYIDELDSLYRTLITGRAYSEHPVGGFLGMNAHALFLSAIGTSIRGQIPSSFMIQRGCVESSLYAYLVGLKKSDGDIWLNRDKNKDLAKSTFTANRAIQKLRIQDPNLADMAKDTYEWMIDFGGHPNPRSVLSHIRPGDKEPSGDHPFSLIYIHEGGSSEVVRAITACIENACLSVAILCHAMPKHPGGSGIFEKVWPLFQRFQKFLRDEGRLRQNDTHN